MKLILTMVLLIITTGLLNNQGVLFNSDMSIDNWYVVNDGVMGGLSIGNFVKISSGNAVFSGEVSLENNGGFTSIRNYFEQPIKIDNYESIAMRVNGDGNEYQFRLKDENSKRFDYIVSFKTVIGWQNIIIPLSEFEASFRGNKLDLPNFDGEILTQIAILIGNKQEQNFNLEIEKIELK